MSAASPRPHPAAILIENLAPMVGVLFFGWSVAPVMVVFWIENGLRGLETAARLALTRGGPDASSIPLFLQNRLQTPPEPGQSVASEASTGRPEAIELPFTMSPSMATAGRLGLVLFFLVHYGVFWVVHGVFVFVLFVSQWPGGAFGGVPGGGMRFGGSGLPTAQIIMAAALIAATLAASVARDFLQSGSRDQGWPIGLIARAYGRMILLHVVLIFGGFAVMALGSPTPALVLLIGLKTAAELTALRLDAPRPPA